MSELYADSYLIYNKRFDFVFYDNETNHYWRVRSYSAFMEGGLEFNPVHYWGA